jgi:hypothetical protein
VVSPKSQARVAVLAGVRAALGTSQYFGALLLGGALSAAWLRRHLMSLCSLGCGWASGASSVGLLGCSRCRRRARAVELPRGGNESDDGRM